MEKFTLEQVAHWTHGALLGAPVEICAVSTDSRHIGEGCLFLPLRGERFDAHDFIAQAVQNGARAVLSDRAAEAYPVPCVRVADVNQALLDLAGGYRREMDARVVGVTGSVGKTTTKEMIGAVLREHCETMWTQGNLNNEVGLPLTVLRMEKSTRAAVLEMGMNHFGEIARMAAAARPDLAVITNIGVSHIEFLGSQAGILQAKLEILTGMPRDGVAILCGDDPLLWEQRGKLPCKTLYYGVDNPACDLTAEDIVSQDALVRFEIRNRALWDCRQIPVGEGLRVHLGVAGRHNVRNALAAAAVALCFGEEPGDIAAGLAAFRPAGLRQNVYEKGGFLIFADCYNASPEAVEAALQTLGELGVAGRRRAVLGGMLELGDYHKEGHLRAGRAAARYADALYLYGAGAEEMAQGAAEAGMPEEAVHIYASHEAMAGALRQDARPGDALLFKGSRGMHMERVLERFTEDAAV